MNKLPIQTCQFVQFSDLFQGCPAAADLFSNTDPNCSWGDNNRTMVVPHFITNHLKSVADFSNRKRLTAEQRQVKTVLARLDALPADVYVDLEN